ncbi:hypothetical protein DFP72DRAFT_970228 [Ephemerocybe angulata]|uniref:Uncharacterized protein n=1 Tax=Ephemerocybe angulata TaxID=980116 RepID=A0A8H6HN53_9AGAR|nr:hypothetical protein DFP72DRAFT_970228 [Tulosesus angulatus]
MFSSFTQFLPSALQNTISSHSPPHEQEEKPLPQSNFDPSTDDEGDEDELIKQQSQQMEDEDKRKVKSKKEKDGKMATETLVFVRPPPSKTNHPLNLQVQLVPPNARPPSGVQMPSTPTSAASFASTSSDGDALSRTSTNHSDYSSNYASNSTTSFASIASSSADTSSTKSGSSGRSARRIIPLYNLQAHNVLPNVIADAGTDAKIAKFQKKGLELIDLAVLEPVEVWGVRNRTGEKQAKKQGMRISVDETGTIVHTGLGVKPAGLPSSRATGGFLQPKFAKDGSRPGTPSANSSALSLNSNSMHFSNQPQLVISPPPPSASIHPPASAPPVSGTFPASQLPPISPTPPSRPIDIAPTIAEHPHDATPPAIVVSTTPTKKSSAANLFGKFKFNSKRNSALNPLSSQLSSSPEILPSNGAPEQGSSTPPQPPVQSQLSDIAKFAMAPMNAKRPSTLSAPLSPASISSQNSNTPTPTPTTPHPRGGERHQNAGYSEDEVGPTPTGSPAVAAFNLSPTETGSSGNASPRPLSIGGALTRGRNKFISGIKGAATASMVDSPPASSSPLASSTLDQQLPQQLGSPPSVGGAKSFFNKLTAGITGNNERNQQGQLAGPSRVSGLFTRESERSRESVDSNTSGNNGREGRGTTSPFGRLLHHSGSQQFIGKGSFASPTASGASSVNPSPRPSQDQSSLPHVPLPLTLSTSNGGSAAPSPLPLPAGTPFQNQTFSLQQQAQLHAHQLSLRQLQLRPPVLGIQPTYVSASQAYVDQHQPTPSTVNLTLNLPALEELAAGSSTNLGGHNGNGGSGTALNKMESFSSFGEADESVASASISGSRRRRRSRPRASDGMSAAASTTGTSSRRTSLNLEKDKDGMLVTTPGSTNALVQANSGGSQISQLVQQGERKEKERALMYVWLVARWLKKRGSPPSRGTSIHAQSVSENNGNGAGGRARDLFRDILPRRDKDGENRSMLGSDREAKRGSWHAGAGIGLLPSLGAFHHTQSASSSSAAHVPLGMDGKPLVLGPVVGGGFEVRFEWKRAKTRSSKAKNKGDDGDAAGNKRGRSKVKERKKSGYPEVKERDMAVEEGVQDDDTPRIIQGPMVETSPKKMSLADQKRVNRASTISIGSLAGRENEGSDSPSRASSRRRVSILLKRHKDEGGEDEVEEDEGDEDDDTDSEDSETPWVCTLKVRKIYHVQAPKGTTTIVDSVASIPNGEGSGRREEKGEQDQMLRLKVGTLSPTPHHPKVVAMLKVPFPLPDVEVERMKLVKRKPMYGQNSQEEDEGEEDPYYGLTLSAEDIKDIVCSTGLWLVVREGFGGVGKVNRKGDGWKIRG